MTLKEQLEILRGEPIRVFTGDPMDIPCIETSDAERLCKNPVVSVTMITYNHEPYIRQAIEGVMMQKTDFEFELVIGEDCSSDRTREICFEYQKRYPDKIRVLWCDHNLYRNPHPAGDNSTRNLAHCRGEFIAFCEGDDYWTDPLKLQKQVEVMRQHPNVGLCFSSGRIYREKSRTFAAAPRTMFYPSGIMAGETFFKHLLWGDEKNPCHEIVGTVFTASVLIRSSVYVSSRKKFGIFHWKLRLGDVVIWLAVSSQVDVYRCDDAFVVYRETDHGACGSDPHGITLDGLLARVYFARKVLGLNERDLPSWTIDMLLLSILNRAQSRRYPHALCQKIIMRILSCPTTRFYALRVRSWLFTIGMACGRPSAAHCRWASRYCRKLFSPKFRWQFQ